MMLVVIESLSQELQVASDCEAHFTQWKHLHCYGGSMASLYWLFCCCANTILTASMMMLMMMMMMITKTSQTFFVALHSTFDCVFVQSSQLQQLWRLVEWPLDTAGLMCTCRSKVKPYSRGLIFKKFRSDSRMTGEWVTPSLWRPMVPRCLTYIPVLFFQQVWLGTFDWSSLNM